MVAECPHFADGILVSASPTDYNSDGYVAVPDRASLHYQLLRPTSLFMHSALNETHLSGSVRAGWISLCLTPHSYPDGPYSTYV